MATISDPGRIPRTARSRLGLAGNVLFAVLAIFVVTAALLYAGLRIYGIQFYEVTSPSMTPTFGKGSVVAARSAQPHELKIGDIIVFNKAGFQSPYVHRITRIKFDTDLRSVLNDQQGKVIKTTMTYSERTIWTKGDANPVEDTEPSPGANVRGKELFVVPWPFNLMVTHLGKNTLFAFGIAAIGAYVLWELGDAARTLLGRRRRRVAPAQCEEGSA